MCIDTEADQNHPLGTTEHPHFTVDTYLPSELPIAAVMDSVFRNDHKDSFGSVFKMSWFMEMDGYMNSAIWPPNEGSGFTALLQTMQKYWAPQIALYDDELAYHHHNTMYIDGEWRSMDVGVTDPSNPAYTYMEDALNHMIIDQNSYPSTYRAGWYWEDGAISEWLEEWFPYDYTQGDAYFPSHMPGEDRWVTYTEGYLGYAPDSYVEYAFQEAANGHPVILAECAHSYDIGMEWQVYTFHSQLVKYSQQYDVPFRFCGAREAMQRYLADLDYSVEYLPPTLNVSRTGESFTITSDELLWGDHPYVAVKYQNGTYAHASTTKVGTNIWTVQVVGELDKIGVAALDVWGNSAVVVRDVVLIVSISPISAVMDVGQSQEFTSTVSGGTTPYAYQWYLNGTPVSGANSSSWTFTPGSDGSYVVFVNVTDSAGATAKSNIASVTVNSPPSVSINPPSVVMDIGQSVTFFSTVENGTSPYSYQWYLNGSAVLGATSATWSFTSSLIGYYTVYVNVTDDVGVTVKSNDASVVVDPLPVSISPTNVVMDVGQSVTFTSAVSGGTPPFTYQWYLNGAPVAGATSSSWAFIPTLAGTYAVYLNVTDGVGVTVKSNIASVTVNPQLSVSIAPTSVVMNVGQSQTFTSTVSGGTSPYTHQWYLNDSPVSGATSATWIFTPNTVGSYTVFVNVTDSVSVTAQSNIASVTVNPHPRDIFAHGFEGGDYGEDPETGSSWDWGYEVEVVSDVKYQGTYSSKATFTASWQMRVAIAYLNANPVFVRWYCRFDTLPGDDQAFILGWLKDESGDNPWELGIYRDLSGTLFLRLHADRPTFATLDYEHDFQVDRWYCVEVKFYLHTSNGEYRVYLDGTEVITTTGLDTSGNAILGIGIGADSGHLPSLTIWSDCVRVSDVYIGPEGAAPEVPPAASFTYSPTNPKTLELITFDASASTPNGGTITEYAWDFGDGNVTTTPMPIITHKYASAGTYTVTLNVTDSEGLWDTETKQIAVESPPPLIVSISPISAVIDLGQSQQFTSSTSGGIPPYSYQWYLNGTPVSDATTASWMFTPTSTGLYEVYVNVTDSTGVTTQSNTAPITVNPWPTASITPASAVIDSGQSVTFSCVASGGTQPYSYQWYLNGTPVSGANSSSWTFTPGSDGSYVVFVNVTDSVGVTTKSNIASVTVNPQLSVSIAPTSVVMNVGQSQTFTSTVSGGTSPYAHQWYLNDSPVSGATSATWTFTPTTAGTYTVSLKVTDNVGVTVQSNTAIVNVNSALSVTIAPTTVVMDVGQSKVFISTTSGGTSPYTYQWYLNGVPVLGATGSTWTFTPTSAGSYTVYVNVTDNVGMFAQSNNAVVTVNPALLVSISPSLVTMFVGQSQTFTSAVSGGTSPFTYQWYLNGSPTSGATSSNWTFTPTTAGTYPIYVRVTDAANATDESNHATARVNVAPSLVVSISPISAVLDLGQFQLFTSNVSGGISPYTYQWYLNGEPVAGATSSSWTFIPTFGGTYSVYLNVTGSVGATTKSNTASVTVNSQPSVSIAPTSVTLDFGQSQAFTSSVSGGTPPFAYQWYVNDVAVPGANDATWTFAPTSSGSFTIYLNVTDDVGVTVQSNFASVTAIPYADQYAFSVASNSTISALTFNSTSMELSFVVSGPPSTTGFARVTITKTLTDNITNLEVYLDGAPLEYSTTSTDDSWIVYFTYSHSSHQIIIALNPSIAPNPSAYMDREILPSFILLFTIVFALTLVGLMKRRRERTRFKQAQ